MRIVIRATCRQDVVDALADDAAIGPLPNPLDLDAHSPAFNKLLDVSRTRSRCWFNPWMEFTASELAQSRFFQLECRRLVQEGRGDYERNIARLRSLPFITNEDGGRIRLMDTITLRDARLRPNQVACASDWMAEFIVSQGVADVFAREGLTGYALRPVFDSKRRREYDDLFQLYTDRLMPPASIDATTPIHPDEVERGHRRQLACLSYEFDGDPPASDFNRTAEAWSSNDMPVWIVTARVRECFERHTLRGWAFRPVLEVGSDLHATYTTMWADLFARVAASHPQHFF